jgi:hypothetical protein
MATPPPFIHRLRFLSPLGERLGEGVNAKVVSCITPSPSLSTGERCMRTSLNGPLDLSPYAFGILNNFVRPEAHDVPAFPLHQSSATCVCFNAKGMMVAVYLDDKPSRYAGEVCEIGADWMLSAKFRSLDSARAHEFPDLAFGTTDVASELSCFVGVVVFAGHDPIT